MQANSTKIVQENYYNNLFSDLASHNLCSNSHITLDNTLILEFEKHHTGLFCTFSNEEVCLLWNTESQFYNLTLKNEEADIELLKSKIYSILNLTPPIPSKHKNIHTTKN